MRTLVAFTKQYSVSNFTADGKRIRPIANIESTLHSNYLVYCRPGTVTSIENIIINYIIIMNIIMFIYD